MSLGNEDELNLTDSNTTGPSKRQELSNSPTIEPIRLGPPRKRQRYESRTISYPPTERDNDEHARISISGTARGKRKAVSPTPSASTSHRKRSPSPIDSGRESLPTWKTLTPVIVPSPPPDSVAETRDVTPAPGQRTQCATCNTEFITKKGTNHVYCSRCRFIVLNRLGFLSRNDGTGESLQPSADELPDQHDKGDEQDEMEVESAMLIASHPHPTGGAGGESDPPAPAMDTNNPLPAKDSRDDTDFQEGPCRVSPVLPKDPDPSKEPLVEPTDTEPVNPPDGNANRPKTSMNEYLHINDLLYHLAGVTNTIRSSSASINFQGVVTRPLDIAKYPRFPVITERLLHEVVLEVKEKLFLPFMYVLFVYYEVASRYSCIDTHSLPKKQFKTNNGSYIGVVFLCQCREDTPGEPCPGKLQVAVGSASSETGPPTIKINVALEH